MNEDIALSELNTARARGSRLGLERIAKLCALLGNPQDSVPAVHLAGTNGKGSTAAMIASALTAAGHRTGLYLSPYVGDARECMLIDGKPVSGEEFGSVAATVAEKASQALGGDPPTSFELETAIAYQWFKERNCGAAVVETGLGGRLDATNVIAKPMVSVITGISWDHMDILGNTLGSIAREKCGVIKRGGITVCSPCQDPEAMAVIRERAREESNRLVVPDWESVRIRRSGLDGTDLVYGSLALHTPMIGRHQAVNAVTAVEALRALDLNCGIPVTDEHIAEGIAKASLPMRQELAGNEPLVLFDGAHNLDKLTALADTMREQLAGRRTVVVMGMLKDKQVEPSVRLLASLADVVIACKPHSGRALDSSGVSRLAGQACADVRVNDDVAGALADALHEAGKEGAVVVCGSFYLAGPAREVYYRNRKSVVSNQYSLMNG